MKQYSFPQVKKSSIIRQDHGACTLYEAAPTCCCSKKTYPDMDWRSHKQMFSSTHLQFSMCFNQPIIQSHTMFIAYKLMNIPGKKIVKTKGGKLATDNESLFDRSSRMQRDLFTYKWVYVTRVQSCKTNEPCIRFSIDCWGGKSKGEKMSLKLEAGTGLNS